MKLAGDADGDGVITGSDATLILRFYAQAGADRSVSAMGLDKWLDTWFRK